MYRSKRVFNINLNKAVPYLPFIVFTSLFLLGVLLGAIFVGRFNTYHDLALNQFEGFYEIRKTFDTFAIVKESSFCIFVPFIVMFLFGTSIVGFVFIPIILAILGIRFGFLTGYLYITYKLNGIMFSSLILLPSTIVALFGINLLCIEAFHFSKTLSTICINSNRTVNMYNSFKTYCIRSATVLVAPVISVILDVGMTSLFINFFTF